MFGNARSVMIPGYFDTLTIKLYSTRARRKDESEDEMFASPFRYIGAADF